MRFLRAFLRATTIPISFEWTAPLLLLIFTIPDLSMAKFAPKAAALSFCFSLVAIAIGLLFHEWAHGAAGLMAGGRAGEVRVHGFGASVSLAGVPVHKQGAVLAAGPVMNLTVAIAAGGLALLIPLSAAALRGDALDASTTLLISDLFSRIASMNFLLGAFNLLPFGPLDGGALSRLGPRARVARKSAWMMLGLILAYHVTTFLALFSLGAPGRSGFFMGLIVGLGAIVGALLVGWHGVLNALSEDRNEWGDLIDPTKSAS